MRILVSACLLGCPCRYDSQEKRHPEVEALREQGHILVPVCPEQLGGLPTPRTPAERQTDGRVVNQAGEDVTAQYQLGAELALNTAREQGCELAILKERSPSCGSGEIYDGTFSRRLVPGEGVTTELLRRAGITVLGESELQKQGAIDGVPMPRE